MTDNEATVRLLVLDRGHVLVGRCVPPCTVGLWLEVTDARTVRRWGTTAGLAELQAGPTAETVLDAVASRVTVPVRAVLYTIDSLDPAAWEPHLRPAVTPARRAARAGVR